MRRPADWAHGFTGAVIDHGFTGAVGERECPKSSRAAAMEAGRAPRAPGVSRSTGVRSSSGKRHAVVARCCCLLGMVKNVHHVLQAEPLTEALIRERARRA